MVEGRAGEDKAVEHGDGDEDMHAWPQAGRLPVGVVEVDRLADAGIAGRDHVRLAVSYHSWLVLAALMLWLPA